MQWLSWSYAVIGLLYVLVLFGIASYADRRAKASGQAREARPLIYALSIAVYCTSWTYFGSVGLAARTGYDFIPVYLGPILVFLFGTPLLLRAAEITRRQNVASIADFLAARYGKSQRLAALVAIISLIGLVPYISIQLKALSFSFHAVFAEQPEMGFVGAAGIDFALPVTIVLAVFTILFGTRHIDTTEHQHGLMAAVAAESIIKLMAFLAVGLYITFVMAGGLPGLGNMLDQGLAAKIFSSGPSGERWLAVTLMSACAILLLPRQFYVTFVENAHRKEIKRARWLFPLYLVLINIFVIPIAIYGVTTLPNADADTFVLALPLADNQRLFALIAFIGGISAATAMVIVETIALSIMLANNIFVPLIASRTQLMPLVTTQARPLNLALRRYTIVGILALAYVYYYSASNSAALAQTGLISFAAITQFAPAFIAALVWPRGTSRGAIAGITAGFLVWAYTLLIPSFVDSGWVTQHLLLDGPFGIAALRPRQLLGVAFEPLTHGVFWSLLINTFVFVSFSYMRAPKRIELQQALAFSLKDEAPSGGVAYPAWRSRMTLEQFEEAIARYLGQDRTRRALMQHFDARGLAARPDLEVDLQSFRYGERLLSSAIGPASSRLVLGLLIERNAGGNDGSASKLLDDASTAVSYSRDLLQAAIDNVPQGIAVFDKDMYLSCYNKIFPQMLHLNETHTQIGISLQTMIEDIGMRSQDAAKLLSNSQLEELCRTAAAINFQLGLRNIEAKGNKMPDGGIVVTFADVTEAVQSADVLRNTNEMLEQRVKERTKQLNELNTDLQRAKGFAEQANVDKTRFIASASHDILQPLNAARLFTAALVESAEKQPTGNEKIVGNLSASLEAVEDILSTVLDMSKLDAGAIIPDIQPVRVAEIFEVLEREFEPIAKMKGLQLHFVKPHAMVMSDRKLLRRVLQNLVSNAIKYTTSGHVLVGCRRRQSDLEVQVLDTGIGIPESKRALVFKEFERLDQDKGSEPGLGLGLSIVERMCRVMGHTIAIQSVEGRGTRVSVTMRMSGVDASVTETSVKMATLPGSLDGLHVIVIDDQPTITEGLRLLLERWGIKVEIARAREEAIGLAVQSKQNIDVIISDYHLAQGDGIAVIETLRQACGWPVPAILTTADRSTDVQKKAASVDIHYLAKPIKPAALRGILARYAGARRVAAE